MNNKSGNLWVWLLTLPLLGYSMFRNLDLIVSTMGNDAGAIVAGAGALFALLFWLFAFNGARGNQRMISGLMIVLDLLGACAGLLADTLLHGGQNKEIVEIVARWAIPIIIGGNFAAGIAYHAVDPDKLIRDKQRALDDTLKLQLAEALANNSGAVVESALPLALANMQQEARAHFLAQHGGQTAPSVPALATVPAIDYNTLATALLAAQQASANAAVAPASEPIPVATSRNGQKAKPPKESSG
jgi:hypothetical protein